MNYLLWISTLFVDFLPYPHWSADLHASREADWLRSGFSLQKESTTSRMQVGLDAQWIAHLWWQRDWLLQSSWLWNRYEALIGMQVQETMAKSQVNLATGVTSHWAFHWPITGYIIIPSKGCCISSNFTIQWKGGEQQSMRVGIIKDATFRWYFEQTLALWSRVQFQYGLEWPTRRWNACFQFSWQRSAHRISFARIPDLPMQRGSAIRFFGAPHD